MAGFIVKNLIAGKLTWSQVEKSRIYCKYADVVLAMLEKDGYKIDADGKCIKD